MRAVIVVLDGVGLGEAPDAAQYGDTGSNTLANTAKAVGGLHLPNMERMGLGNLARECGVEIAGVRPTARPEASYARMHPASAGKDTTTGHWELAGVKLDQPFPTYPRGFPTEIIQEFEAAIGRRVLGNYPASGTEIIQKLGDEHVRTGRPIVYTSADSVFQIAAHEEVIPLQELYAMCQTARRILKPPHGVGRVIARPFIGTSGNYVRTGARRDFSLEPPGPTLLDVVSAAGMDVMACGKIDDIFAGKGITRSSHVAGNDAVFDAMLDFLRAGHDGLIFANLVDFDMKWGHRNDPEAFAAGLEHFDARLPELLDLLGPGDLVAICADHGNDPTTPSTDHSRESVPLLLYCPREPSPSKPAGVWLGERRTFADLGASIAHFLGLQWNLYGQSFMGMVP
ncbi:MAG: phosphopentomutase [Bacillota bacterium]|jgi:phosphopentomutase|nr:phosphopentomutase [Bacillota bacterium]